jgi:sporulation protein YlmC with PRC-barrel domain
MPRNDENDVIRYPDDISDADRPAETTRRVDPSSPGGALVHTKDLDRFSLPDGRPDPRGWDVKSADGTRLGKVEDLLVDSESQQVRYIEIAVHDDVVKAGGRDYALVPIGAARLDDDGDDVIVNLTTQDLCDVPVYDRQRMSRDYEQSLHGFVAGRSTMSGRSTAMPDASRADTHMPTDTASDLYASPHYDDRSFFGSRGARTSGAADRATTSGVGDRLADAADDLKDRVDGNPASRPGPDATDRRI